MNHEQAFEFMTSLLKHFVQTDDYPVFKKLGINADDIPSEYRSQFADFERIAKNNLSLAKIKFSEVFGNIPGESKKLNLNIIANNYHANAKAIRCFEFLENIRRSPLDAERLAKDFLRSKSDSVGLLDLRTQIETTVLEIEAAAKNGTFETLIPYWENLSKTVGGFNPGCVFIITAKTGVGKTALALNIATSAMREMNVIYFNMEMLVSDIVKRIFMANGGLTRNDIANCKLYDNQKFYQWYSSTIGNDKSLLISDGRALSIDEITSTIAKENQKKKIGLVIIDYDQKIRTANVSDQWKELHQAIEQIEEISKMCELPILLLAQGDDDGAIKASKRMTQSATAQFDFYYDENATPNKNERPGAYILEAKKNRHGVYGRKIIVKYDPSRSLCTEGDYYEPAFNNRTL